MVNRSRYVACGSMARMMQEMAIARALADERGKLLLFYHPKADLLEVAKFAGLLTPNSEKIVMIDGSDEAALKAHLDVEAESILIVNGEKLPISFQATVGDPDFKWPKGWTIVAPADGGSLMMPHGPWATCFAANAIWRSKAWRNIGERSRREVLEMARHVFRSTVEAEDVFMANDNAFEPIESLVRSKMLHGLGDILDIATAACLAATQEQRRTVSSADVFIAIAAGSRSGTNRNGPNQATLAAALT